MEMTHGDAIVILRTETSEVEDKLEALKVIFDNELKYDYNCLTKPQLWRLVRFLYREFERRNNE